MNIAGKIIGERERKVPAGIENLKPSGRYLTILLIYFRSITHSGNDSGGSNINDGGCDLDSKKDDDSDETSRFGIQKLIANARSMCLGAKSLDDQVS